VKKLIRDGADEETLEQKKIEIGYELGDVLWYCAMLAREVDINLGHIMEKNIEKLHSRKERGTLGGSGDNR
jgi:NTP pyrophosphatase (non-canonical NTP hydrolase)